MGFRASIDVTALVERAQRGYMPELEEVPARDPGPRVDERPLRFGGPVDQFSTDTRVATWQAWDPNGWYFALGFRYPFHDITRRTVARAYREVGGVNPPPLLAWMAWVLMARNPLAERLREEYRRLPYGRQHDEDPRFQDAFRAQLAREVARRRLAGQDTSEEEVAAEFGVDLHSIDDVAGAADQRSATVVSEEPETPRWNWGYFLWKSRCTDLERLSRWQTLLVAAFAAAGEHRRISVGFMGRQPHRATVCEMTQQIVLLLHEDVEPTPDLAEQLAASCTISANRIPTKEIHA